MTKQTKFTKQIEKLTAGNKLKRLKLRAKLNVDTGTYSVYLDHYNKGVRTFHFIEGIKLSPDNPQNEELIRKALAYRDKLEADLLDDSMGIKNSSWKRNANFVEYFREVGKTKGTGIYQAALKAVIEYHGESLPFKALDRDWVEGFRNWLLSHKTNNTASQYLAILKVVINDAVNHGIIMSSPARGISIPKLEKLPTHLTVDEVKRIEAVDRSEVRDAFLFACYTGLRISDVQSLSWEDIADGYYTITQTKTKVPIKNKLSEPAWKILGTRAVKTGRIFSLPTRPHINRKLDLIAKAAGIIKHVTFHSSRHTFATLMLSEGKQDIYTVSKLLGHTDIAKTQRYAKVVDAMKDEAVNSFNDIWRKK